MRRKVLAILPSAIVSRGLEQIFRETGEFVLSWVLTELSDARIRSAAPDIIIVDPLVADSASREGLRAHIGTLSDAPVIAFKLMNDGAEGFDTVIGLSDSPATVVKKLRTALDGHSDPARREGGELSAREKEILVCVAKGMLNKEIADKYCLSIHTVITHRKNISRKTGIKTVAGLTVYALLNNLIDINSVE
ncbi:MAG: response regulator transcription factor [Bacteroidales bacterium]|nr:response regulator transcription factor [Bacteroidales bacterium]